MVAWRKKTTSPQVPLVRRQSDTRRIVQRPVHEDLPKDCCTLTKLTGSSPGSMFTVKESRCVLGRDEDLPWRIDDDAVSGRHACVYRKNGWFWLADLDSTNGTYVNGRAVTEPHQLRDGERIELGARTLIRVSLQDEREHEATRRVYEAAVLDPLTGLYNRGHLEKSLAAEFAYSVRHRVPLSVAFVDLDHFTRVNNTYGHQAGDAVLRAVCGALREGIRTEDFIARYGGEEIVVVARGIDLNGAIAMAERLRRIVETTPVAVDGAWVEVTASFGVASFEAATPYANVHELVAAADRAVYRAKAMGRNCVCEAVDRASDSWRCG